MDMIPTQSQCRRSKGTCPRIFIERTGNAAPFQIIIIILSERSRKALPRQTIRGNSRVRNLNGLQTSVRQQSHKLVPKLGHIAPLKAKIANEASRLELRKKLAQYGAVYLFGGDVPQAGPAR